MTPDELQTELESIISTINAAADTISPLVPPQALPLIVLAKAVDKLLPGTIAMIDRWIQGKPPTATEKQTMLAQLSVLGNPDLP